MVLTTTAATAPHVTAARRRLAPAPLGLGAGLAGAAALLAVRSPYTAGSYGFCPIVELTGLWCPGCGGLRAAHSLVHLDLAAAWAMNPLLVAAAPFLVALWARWAWRAWRGVPTPHVTVRAAVALGVVLLTFMVARNLPGLEPWLAP